MMKKEYIVFVGKKFTIEWYFNANGKSQALEYFNELSRESKLEVFSLFKAMAMVGKIRIDFYVSSLPEEKLLSPMHLRKNKISYHHEKKRKLWITKKIIPYV